VTSARNGEQLACAELCRRHRETVLRVVLRITRNLDDAEDVLQDSWMRAFTHIGTFDGRSAFSTWVTRIAINSALGMIRKSGRHKEVSLDDPADPHRPGLTEMLELSRDPEERCLEGERLKLVRQAIRRLPLKLRSAVEIRQSQDGPVSELAILAGVSLPTMKSRLNEGQTQTSRTPIKRLERDSCVRRLTSDEKTELSAEDISPPKSCGEDRSCTRSSLFEKVLSSSQRHE